MAVALARLTNASAWASLPTIGQVPARTAAAWPAQIGGAKPDSAKPPHRKAFGSITW